MKKLTLLTAAVLIASSTLVAKEFISIGTGSMTGTYYPVGGAISRLVNKNKDFKASAQSTGGSVYNVNNVMKGELNFGFVQSDIVYDKYNGKGKFEGKGDDQLRSVMAIYPELQAFVVSKASGIKSYADAKGKNINIGNPGSGSAVTALLVLKEYGVSKDMLGHYGVLTVSECPMALKDKKIQGYFFTAGHPTANITDAANSLPIDLVGIGDKQIAALIKLYPYYAKGVIPKGLYEGVDHDTTTIGVKAVLVTSAKQSDASVAAVVKAVLDNFEEYKRLHPALKYVTKQSLLEGLSAPLHPAAKKVYQEAGLLK